MEIDITDRIADLKAGQFRTIELDSRDHLVYNLLGVLRVFSRICPHAGGDLSKARFENHTITCMNHGLCYRLEDGSLDLEKVDEDIRENVDEEILSSLRLKLLPVRESEGRILVSL